MTWAVASIFLQQGIASGLVTGSVYALLAISAVMIFKTSELPNFALGEFFMVGAMTALFGITILDLPLWIVIPVVIAFTFLVGALVNRLVILPIERARGGLVTMVIATLGVSYILKGLARLSDIANEPKSFPSLFSSEPMVFGEIVLTMQDIVIFIVTLIAMAAFFLFFGYTRTGRAMRAVGMNPKAAALVGVNLPRIRMMIWGLSAALSALAAILIAPKLLITPDIGATAILAFAAAIIGGFNSLPGAAVGGFIIGIVENLAGTFISSNSIVVAPFAVIMVTLLLRPQGLFGKPFRQKKL